MTEPFVKRTEIYTGRPTARHKDKCSVYLVEKMGGSNIVAQIRPLGMVTESVAAEELGLIALKERLSIADEPQTKGRHTVRRVVKGII